MMGQRERARVLEGVVVELLLGDVGRGLPDKLRVELQCYQ